MQHRHSTLWSHKTLYSPGALAKLPRYIKDHRVPKAIGHGMNSKLCVPTTIVCLFVIILHSPRRGAQLSYHKPADHWWSWHLINTFYIPVHRKLPVHPSPTTIVIHLLTSPQPNSWNLPYPPHLRRKTRQQNRSHPQWPRLLHCCAERISSTPLRCKSPASHSLPHARQFLTSAEYAAETTMV